MTRRFGGHASTAGNLAKGGLAYIERTRATAVQVYVSNSRAWALHPGTPAHDEAFRAGCAERDVAVYIHACLLVNLGSPTPATVERSVACLRHALHRGRAIGATGVVFHAGSAVTEEHAGRALRQVREVLLPVLDDALAVDDGPRLMVEPSAGGGRCLAKRVEDLAPYLDAVDRHPALGVCFDTCHAWAAGHDLATPGGMASTVDALLAAVGPDRLWLVHANDSKDACGSARDRHENVGRGTIGAAAFAELLAHPAVAGVPVLVETPDADGDGHHVDIARLRDLAVTRARRRPRAAAAAPARPRRPRPAPARRPPGTAAPPAAAPARAGTAAET